MTDGQNQGSTKSEPSVSGPQGKMMAENPGKWVPAPDGREGAPGREKGGVSCDSEPDHTPATCHQIFGQSHFRQG
jgi:hypothetical protein